MKKRSSFDMEIGSSIDLSLLRRPLTPFTGFQEAKSAFEKGTAEVRHLLLHECSLIYECNICRNMFRSLANFISHKRVFCCKSALERNDSHDSTSYTETRKSSAAREYLPPKNSELHQKHMQVSASVDDAATAAKKTRLLKAENQNQAENKQEYEQPSIEGNKNNLATNLNETSNQHNVQQNADQSSTSYVFQCPSCSLTFLKSSSVIRHLASAHNIPMRRIRMLRDTITKRPAETVLLNGDDDLPQPKPNRELKNLQLAAAAESSSSTVTTNTKSINDDEVSSEGQTLDEDLSKCIFCQKSFERRATLSAHLQTCHIKLEMLEGSTTTKSPTPNSKRMRLQSNASLEATIKNQLTTMPAIAADVDCDDVKRTFEHLEQQDFGGGLQTVSLDKLDISAGESTNASMVMENEDKTEEAKQAEATDAVDDANLTITAETSVNIAAEVALPPPPPSPSSSSKKRKIRTNCIMKQSCRCKICGKQFNALSNLRRHISMFHYRSRKFGCALCDYCAFRRYDIINHLGFVHKLSGEDNAETAKLVRVNDVHYTKDDMDEDIVLLGAEVATAEDNSYKGDDENQSTGNGETTSIEPEKQTEKRRRRRTKNLVSQMEKQLMAETAEDAVDSTIEVKQTRQTLKRSLSQNSACNSSENVHSSTKSNQKRPTRNRVKPVNKDFVYDLNDVLKKEQAQTSTALAAPVQVETETYHLRGSKRRNTLNAGQPEIKPPVVPAFEYIKPKTYATIKGAARRSCLLLVNMGLAKSSTLPDIPSERPQMRSRLISLQRSDSQAGPVIETTELDAARLNSLPLCDDSYLEKIAKENVGTFEMKPCLAQQHSALDTLLQKVDFSKNFFNGGMARTAVNNQISSELNEVVVQTNYLDAAAAAVYDHSAATIGTIHASIPMSPCYVTPEQTIPKAFVTPSKPQKRLPSLDRLTEAINSSGDSYYNATLLEH